MHCRFAHCWCEMNPRTAAARGVFDARDWTPYRGAFAKATNHPGSTKASSETIKRAEAAAAWGRAPGRCTSCNPLAAGATKASAAVVQWPTEGGCRASVPESRSAGARFRAPTAAAPWLAARAAQRWRCGDPEARRRDGPRNAAACRWEAFHEERTLWSGDKRQPRASNS